MTTNATPAAPSTPAASSQPASTPAQTGGGAKTGADPAPATQAGSSPAKPPEAQNPRTYELKVNGKVQKLTEEELIARARMGEAADQRFNEAAKLRKETEAHLGRLRDPEQVMDALLDPKLGYTKEQIRAKFEEWYEREFIEPEKLTEDQKKLREAEARLKKYADEDKQRAEAKTKAEQEQLTEKARGEIQSQIIEALDSGALPKTNFTVRRLAYWIQRNQANGFNAPTSLLVSQVRNEFTASMRDMVEASDGEKLIQLLGDGIVQKIRKYDLEQLKKLRGGGGITPTEGEPSATDEKRDRPLTSAEVTQRLRNLQRTGRY
jgi:hypothetical protein